MWAFSLIKKTLTKDASLTSQRQLSESECQVTLEIKVSLTTAICQLWILFYQPGINVNIAKLNLLSSLFISYEDKLPVFSFVTWKHTTCATLFTLHFVNVILYLIRTIFSNRSHRREALVFNQYRRHLYIYIYIYIQIKIQINTNKERNCY